MGGGGRGGGKILNIRRIKPRTTNKVEFTSQGKEIGESQTMGISFSQLLLFYPKFLLSSTVVSHGEMTTPIHSGRRNPLKCTEYCKYDVNNSK